VKGCLDLRWGPLILILNHLVLPVVVRFECTSPQVRMIFPVGREAVSMKLLDL